MTLIFSSEPRSFRRPEEMNKSISFLATSSVDMSSGTLSGSMDSDRYSLVVTSKFFGLSSPIAIAETAALPPNL